MEINDIPIFQTSFIIYEYDRTDNLDNRSSNSEHDFMFEL